jgi:hypothetical protein
MVWNGSTGQVDVYLGLNGGQISGYPLESYSGVADNLIPDEPPAGRNKPINAFGRVWSSQPQIREALGWAVGGEIGYTMTVTMRFDAPGAITITLPNNTHVYQLRSNWNY